MQWAEGKSDSPTCCVQNSVDMERSRCDPSFISVEPVHSVATYNGFLSGYMIEIVIDHRTGGLNLEWTAHCLGDFYCPRNDVDFSSEYLSIVIGRRSWWTDSLESDEVGSPPIRSRRSRMDLKWPTRYPHVVDPKCC